MQDKMTVTAEQTVEKKTSGKKAENESQVRSTKKDRSRVTPFDATILSILDDARRGPQPYVTNYDVQRGAE